MRMLMTMGIIIIIIVVVVGPGCVKNRPIDWILFEPGAFRHSQQESKTVLSAVLPKFIAPQYFEVGFCFKISSLEYT